MKTFLHKLLAAFALLGAAAVSVHAVDSTAEISKSEQRPVSLQVTATLPASANVIRDADIAETFGYLIATKLREQGFRGRIRYVDYARDIDPKAPHLALNLVEWRVDPLGNVDCRFTARLSSPRGSKSLGDFMGSAMLAWPFGSWSARDAAFEQAAAEPVKELLNKMRATGLVESVN